MDNPGRESQKVFRHTQPIEKDRSNREILEVLFAGTYRNTKFNYVFKETVVQWARPILGF
jgi:hypothetical protein